MSFTTYSLGYPRIGEKRELKFALEGYFAGKNEWSEVEALSKELRLKHLKTQKEKGIDLIPVNDFSYYDGMLDMIRILGVTPARFRDLGDPVELTFAMARGDETHTALAMQKWFDTNYHYMVPELDATVRPMIDTGKIEREYAEAKSIGITPSIRLIGPLTFLGLSSCQDVEWPTLLPIFVQAYETLFQSLSQLDDQVIFQIDEPILVQNPESDLLELLQQTYTALKQAAGDSQIIVATYFDQAGEAVRALCQTPVDGIALDFVKGIENLEVLDVIAKSGQRLLAGVVDGRNVWISDLADKVSLLEKIADIIGQEKLSVGPSCSLLHVPYSTQHETKMNPEIRSWLAYAEEKCEEVATSGLWLKNDPEWQAKVSMNSVLLEKRRDSSLLSDPAVKKRVEALPSLSLVRSEPYAVRIQKQHEKLNYPLLPTTTIGSFPQTPEVRRLRKSFKNGEISEEDYTQEMRTLIDGCVAFQESIGLDVLVHGEFERNDMVEYFGEQMQGVCFSQNGWVQSYGTRCVKPPHIYGDVSRPEAMTLEWITYAQSLSEKPMKGMLTGPVTMLNWSFVRDDVPYETTMRQMALAIRDEVDDLQLAGVPIIQVDEAAFKEGYPLRLEKRESYEKMAVESFLIATSVAQPEVQIHTHMCYSEFSDIIQAIETMDADVISIETARGGNRLLEAFQKQGYTKEIGLGVYDIHSPRIPSSEEIETQIRERLKVLPALQVWINPDCGLKTRKWKEVKPALQAMVEANEKVRSGL